MVDAGFECTGQGITSSACITSAAEVATNALPGGIKALDNQAALAGKTAPIEIFEHNPGLHYFAEGAGAAADTVVDVWSTWSYWWGG